MAETYQLTVAPRDLIGKSSKKLRRQGLLPGIVYGYNLEGATAVQMDERTFERIYHRAGTAHLVDLHIGETGAGTPVFIHGVKRDPISHVPTHVDFMAVNLRREITTHVQIVLVGEALAVREDLGLMQQTLEALNIKVLPTAVPESITADVSGLSEVGAAIHVRDLPVPPGVTVLNDPDEEVARITAVSVLPEEEVAATEAAEAEAEASAEGAGAEG